ncbi:MAG: hypothetical protein ACREX8_00155, partial [Gammaproteobacteria bacterium]
MPSLAGLHKKIATEVAKIRDIEIDVTPNMKGFHKTLATEVAKIRDVEVAVTPNLAGFREKVRAATAGIGATGLTFTPEVDTRRARAQTGAFATELRKRLDAATTALGDIRLDVDASPAERKIAVVRAKLATLSNQRIGVHIDADQAARQITMLSTELTALGAQSPNIQVRVDSARAVAELALLRRGFAGATRDGNVLSRGLVAVGSGIGGLTSVIGGAVTGLGSLIGSGTRAGSVLTSLGTSIGGARSGLGSLGSVAGSAASAMVGLVASAAPLVALGALIAGAGAVATAGIGQLGGAVIALGSGIVPLAGLLGTLPGLIAPIGVAAGALVLAFGDAGLKGALDRVKNAFTPVVSALRDQMRPALTELLGSIAQLAPTIKAALPPITSALSSVARGFSDIFKTSSFKADLTSIMSEAGATIRGFGTAAQSVFRGVIDMMIAAQPAVRSLVALVQEGAAKFAAFMAEGRRTGELAAFFQQGVDVLRQLMGVVGNLTGLFKDFWESANRTGAFQATLGAINDGVTRFRDYVSEAGGAWDQLMAKAGPITASIVRLVESIGKAFVDMGAKVDIVPLLDSISDAISDLTPTFQEIANVAVPAFQRIVETGKDLTKAIGPEIASTIQGLADAFRAIAPSLETILPFLGEMAVNIGRTIAVVANFIDHLITLGSITKKVFTGDFAGAKADWDGLQARTKAVADAMNGIPPAAQAATGEIQSFAEAARRGVVFNIDTTSISPKINEAKAVLGTFPQTWLTRFLGDVTNIGAAVGVAVNETASVPAQHGTAFTGDTAPLGAAIGQARANITSVPQSGLTRFLGDIVDLGAKVGAAAST